MRLADFQSLFWREVTTPGLSGADLGLSALFKGDTRLDAQARLGIYASMYRARLVDVLHIDFPILARALGAERFEAFATAFVRSGPSVDPDLSRLSLRFPGFLEVSGADRWAIDLAHLEAARVVVFLARDVPPITLDELRALSPDAWPALRLALVPSCLVVDVQAKLEATWNEGAAPGVGQESFLVWRIGRSTHITHRRVEDVEKALLDGIAMGEPFAALCERAAVLVTAEEAPREAGGWLLRWVEDGVVTTAH